MNNNTSREQKVKALKIAKLKEDDASEMQQAVEEISQYANLNKESATVVAQALRNKYLLSSLQEEGLTKEAMQEFDPQQFAQHDLKNTNDFANKSHEDDENMGMNDKQPQMMGLGGDDSGQDVGAQSLGGGDSGMGGSGDSMGGGDGMGGSPMGGGDMSSQSLMSNDTSDDSSKDGSTVKFEIEVPEEDAADFHKALEQLLGQNDSDDDTDADTDNLPASAGKDDEEDDSSDDAGDDVPGREASRKGNKTMMTKQALAERAQKREKLAQLANLRLAEEDQDDEDRKPKDIGLGRDTSGKGSAFEHAADAQPKNEDKFETFQMENSDGNSLKGENPNFGKTKVPTKNPENLQLRDSIDVISKDGDGSSSIQYDVDFGILNNVPSANPDRGNGYAIPTQMGDQTAVRNPRSLATASLKDCLGCTNPEAAPVHTVLCNDCRTKVAICEDCEQEGYCPTCAGYSSSDERTAASNKDWEKDQQAQDYDEKDITKGQDNQFEGTDTPNTGGDGRSEDKLEKEIKAQVSRANEIFRARLAKAYSWSAKFASRGLINEDEIDAHAELWMRDGLSVQAMNSQGNLMLRSAQTSAQRVQVAANERNSNTRTGNVGVSTNVAVASAVRNDATSDLKEALSGIWTTPDTEYPEDKFKQSNRAYLDSTRR